MRSFCSKLAVFVLAVTCSVFAADNQKHERCFLAIPFADGNTASIQLSNAGKAEQTIDIERYSSNGRLLERTTRTVPQVRTLSLGWICPRQALNLAGFECSQTGRP